MSRNGCTSTKKLNKAGSADLLGITSKVITQGAVLRCGGRSSKPETVYFHRVNSRYGVPCPLLRGSSLFRTFHESPTRNGCGEYPFLTVHDMSNPNDYDGIRRPWAGGENVLRQKQIPIQHERKPKKVLVASSAAYATRPPRPPERRRRLRLEGDASAPYNLYNKYGTKPSLGDGGMTIIILRDPVNFHHFLLHRNQRPTHCQQKKRTKCQFI